MEMSLPSFGFNITFDQSKVKPIIPESYNTTVLKTQSVISLANDYIDGVSISKSSDSTDPLNTISKEDMIILNERSEEKIYTIAESKDDDDKETVVKLLESYSDEMNFGLHLFNLRQVSVMGYKSTIDS